MAKGATALTSTATLPATNGKPKFDLSGDSSIVTAFVTNGLLPDDDIVAGSLRIAMNGQAALALPSGTDSVTFDGSASAFSAIGAYIHPAKVVEALELSDEDAGQLKVDFGASDTDRWMVLRWGYGLSGGAAGKVALGAYGNATFGVSGSSEGLFAVVRRVPRTLLAKDAFFDVMNNWTLPRSVPATLPVGTWLITEVDGKLDASVGITAGYDFTWVKHAELEGLSGDVGLRVLAGIKANLGVTLAGKYVLVLSCEAPNVIRYRLFRTSTKGWNFALHAGAQIDPTTGTVLPEHLDGFLKALFGVHDAQLLKFLEAASTQEIVDLLGNQFLASLNPAGDIANGFTQLKTVLAKWGTAPHDVTSVLWKYLPDNAAIGEIASAAAEIAGADQQTLQAILDRCLKNANFHELPIGEWIETAAKKPLFELYDNAAARVDLVDAAKFVKGVLDGSDVQAVLTKVQAQISTLLDIATLQQAAQAQSVAGLCGWVQSRLAAFLKVPVAGLNAKIADVDKIINLVRGKAADFYDSTRKALNTKYALSLDVAHSSSDLKSALMDIDFDLTIGTSFALLQSAVNGDFKQLLSNTNPGVNIRQATLTHSLKRQNHIEIHLPFYSGKSDHVMNAFSTQRVMDTTEGRIQVFEAGAKDEHIDWANASTQRYAACSFGLSSNSLDVRKYDAASVSFSYSFRQARRAMGRAEFTYQFKPIVDTYFPQAFGEGTISPTHAGFASWVSDWDKYTDQQPGAADGDGVIGNTWASLQISLASSPDKDWLSALFSKDEPNYKGMSKAMQRVYRGQIFQSYASDPGNFSAISGPAIDAFFAYVCFPAANDRRLDGNGQVIDSNNDKLIWDVADKDINTAILLSAQTVSAMENRFAAINQMLSQIPNLKKYANFYAPGQAARLAGRIAGDSQRMGILKMFLLTESNLIDQSQTAFRKVRAAGTAGIADSFDAFFAASLKLVSTFNQKSNSVFDTAHVVRYLGPLLLQSAIEGMYPGQKLEPSSAMLDVAVLKGDTLPDAMKEPVSSDTILRQRITNLR